ncbi:MAG: GFA family protein [Candidatus Devosia phytovorans]|uniref:GFA family protein n=1 Tax=Candidatus Devosia phytovorans TaxID=3121372 RepID=A0AAJ5VRJ3_9HYPH|nr:GFA family protein [Devosia sp.]WEK03329.1 MAG: GFA family protein [Devosia sp.]
MAGGSCACGAVTFTVNGPLPSASACHCSKCRKHTGHFEAGVDIAKADVEITGDAAITWYFSSENVRRGFCATCGTPLFFDPPAADWIGINLGAFDKPTGTRLAQHIFVADKGDYYDIADGLPQYDTVPGAK